MTKYFTKEQIMRALEEQNLMLDDIWGVEQRLDELQGADVAPVVHTTTSNGYWDEVYCKWETCDNCHGDTMYGADYCNWCGARLDGGRKQ